MKFVAVLSIQIAYFTGLRIGEACGLTWDDINIDEQYIVVRRSLRYMEKDYGYELGSTKSRKRINKDAAGIIIKTITERQW